MIGREVVGSKEVSFADVEEILSELGEDIGFEQSKTLDYVKKMKKLEKEKAEEMIRELMRIEKIKREKAVKIVDIFPKSEEEVKTIFAKEIFILKDEEIKEILEIVNKYEKER